MPNIIEILHNRLVGRVAIVGVGNPTRGDDGAGPHVVARLEGRVEALLVDAGEAPQEHVDKIAAFKPDVVCIIGAASIGSAAGSLGLIESEELGEASFATHGASLAPFAASLEGETSCQVCAIGIQPKQTALSSTLSPEVEEACYGLVDLISTVLPAESES